MDNKISKILVTCLLSASCLHAQERKLNNAFYFSSGIVIDSKGNAFVTGKNKKIIKINPNGKAELFAGGGKYNKDGTGINAGFSDLSGIAIDSMDNMYVADNTVPIITFTSDGRFIDKGAIKVLYHQSINCINPALTHGSGTYEVKNFTITFNYTDGRKIRIAFPGAGYDKSNPSPQTLQMSFDENTLTRQ